MAGTEEIREQFYAYLDTELRDTFATDRLAILGDFTAKVCRDKERWRGVKGKHGVGKMNGVRVSLLQETGVTGRRPLQPEQQTIVATPVRVCVFPALD